MEMLINSLEDFVKCIPTAAASEWSVLETYVETAQMDLTLNLFGPDLNTDLLALEAEDHTRIIANKLVCVVAYHAAIPFVDVAQTPNGFAVVSNNNLSPASKERVERLIEWCELQIDSLTDMFIKSVLSNAELLGKWAIFPDFKDIVNCFFVTGQDFASYTKSHERKRRTELLKHKAELVVWQENVIAPVISKDYMLVLITAIRTNTFQPGDVNVINFCKIALAALVAGNKQEAEGVLQKLGNLLDWNIESYQVYANSKEYALKNAARDTNQADHPTFFFGI